MVGLPSTSVLDPALGEIVLRVRGTSRDGQIVRLRSPKCTIGSARHCTLRLAAHGVQPLHCLILRGNRGMLVRRWAPGTLLNGRGFTDAELAPGDCLSIGPIELEVLQCDGSPATRSRAPSPTSSPAGPSEPQTTSAAPAPDGSLLGLEQLDEQRAELDRQRQDLDHSRSAWDAERVETEKRLASEQQQLRSRCSELQAQNRAFAEERQLWQTQRRETEAQLDQRAAELEAKAAALEAQRVAMEEERRQWEITRGESGQESSQQTAALNVRRAELEEQRKSLDHKQRALEAERRQWEMQCRHDEQQRQAELDSLRAELVNARRLLEEHLARQGTADAERETCRVVQETQAFAAEPAAPTDNGVKEPVNLSEVFRSLGINPPTDDEPQPPRLDTADRRSPTAVAADEAAEEFPSCDTAGVSGSADDSVEQAGHRPVVRSSGDFGTPEPPAPEATPEPPVCPPAPERRRAAAHPAGDEDESIQAYMARLLQRVGASPEAIERESQRPSPPSSVPTADVPQAEPVAAVPASAPQHKPLKQLAARTVAPEKMVPLSAMRDLANLQAESAISRYVRSKARRTEASKMAVTIIAALSGAMLLLFWRQTGIPLTLLAAAASLVVALWGAQHVLKSRRQTIHLTTWRLAGRKKRAAPAPASDDLSPDALQAPGDIAAEDWRGLLGSAEK
jgi:hypothetical protein